MDGRRRGADVDEKATTETKRWGKEKGVKGKVRRVDEPEGFDLVGWQL
jgi:hypothetical protein